MSDSDIPLISMATDTPEATAPQAFSRTGHGSKMISLAFGRTKSLQIWTTSAIAATQSSHSNASVRVSPITVQSVNAVDGAWKANHTVFATEQSIGTISTLIAGSDGVSRRSPDSLVRVTDVVTFRGGQASGKSEMHLRSARRSEAPVPSLPGCPEGNNTIFEDAKFSFQIRCNADNEEPSYNTQQISSGGYASCLAGCSNISTCAGFTYVGLDSGSCYFKSDMPEALYTSKAGDNYISCSKMDATEVMGIASQSTARSGNQGINIKAIIGGSCAAFVVLSLLIIFVIWRRRHKSRIQNTGSARSTLGGFIIPKYDGEEKPPLPLCGSPGSTGHDVFSPYGSIYAPEPNTYFSAAISAHMQPAHYHARQRSVFAIQELDSIAIHRDQRQD